MLKKKEVEEFKQMLLSLAARVRGDVQHLTVEALEGQAGSDSKSPTHIADIGTQAWEQDFSLRVIESDRELLDEISSALKRIGEGKFGICELCLEEGKPVSKAGILKTRLRAIPYARNCVSCERKREELSI